MKKLVTLSAAFLFVISCTTAKNSVGESEEIIKKVMKPKFTLDEIVGDYIVSEMSNYHFSGIIPTLRIESNGNISGNNGCNTFFGRVNPSGLTSIDKLGSTRMACQGEGSEVEQVFMKTMREIDSIAKYGKEVQFFSNGEIMIVATELVLQGNYLVTSVGKVFAENKGINFSIGEGRISGFTGCNTFFGEVKQEGRNVSFKGIGATEKACAEFDNAFESRFLKVLSQASYYTLKEDKIEFYLGVEQLFTVKKVSEK